MHSTQCMHANLKGMHQYRKEFYPLQPEGKVQIKRGREREEKHYIPSTWPKGKATCLTQKGTLDGFQKEKQQNVQNVPN